ncbi:hypothetical protein [Arenimonas sp. MALMAid1274]|uniref:hypothetical protein n=1 Tax=Arenimonas sp. MALMAid1274 TaxID=3411630 RepID=UPI003BA1657B
MSHFDFAPLAGAQDRASARHTLTRGFVLMFLLALMPDAYAWQPGKDGSLTVNANTNYSALAAVRITTLSTAANAGDGTITLASAAGISAGDVLMIYQAQGATIGSGNAATYGEVTNLNNAGRYELVNVFGVVGTVITLSPACDTTPLQFSYASGSQVIRVPQYTTLTIGGAATLSAPAWNGSTGGVMPLIVQNTLTVNGLLSANGAGFRGGVLDNTTTDAGTDVTLFRGTSNADGGEKGESIAGFQTQYDSLNGRYGRGAPANGGGGGNAHNAGGGGGANGGTGTWTGQGNPSVTTAAWAGAWNLEGAGFATSTSPGGGRGGYTYGSSNQNALTLPPGNNSWGGNSRRQRGGLGGRPLANSPANSGNTRIFLGGGGGAGDANNSAGSSGASGGGFILVIAGTVSGSGDIVANGNTATNSTPGHNDAPGGGGGGGSIVISAGSASGVDLFARGGNGGNQLITNDESEGPGGGGGGGFISAPAALATSVTGGASGTTSSGAVTEFLPNGATFGGAGNTTTIPALASLPVCPTLATVTLAVTKADTLTNYTPGGTATYTVVVTNTGNVPAIGTLVDDPLPAGLTLTAPWTCTASTGGSCPASGGTIGGTTVGLTGTVAAGGTLTITIPVAFSANPNAY